MSLYVVVGIVAVVALVWLAVFFYKKRRFVAVFFSKKRRFVFIDLKGIGKLVLDHHSSHRYAVMFRRQGQPDESVWTSETENRLHCGQLMLIEDELRMCTLFTVQRARSMRCYDSGKEKLLFTLFSVCGGQVKISIGQETYGLVDKQGRKVFAYSGVPLGMSFRVRHPSLQLFTNINGFQPSRGVFPLKLELEEECVCEEENENVFFY